MTRSRVLDAALTLFSAKGYAATTVDDIAAEAGVARQTVFTAVGNKRDLIKQARDVALAGDHEPVPMPQRQWVQQLRAAPNAEAALAIYAHAIRRIYERAARLELALAAAAEADPELEPLATQAIQQRHAGCRLITQELVRKARLKKGVTRAHAADMLFATASPEIYRLLVSQREWPPLEYEQWLRTSLHDQLYSNDSR